MIVKAERPPIYADIVKAFPMAARPGTLFCWGEVIFNPGGRSVSPALLVHEAVHSKQQGDNIDAWWRRYLIDPVFRLDQEIPAHQAEYRHRIEHAASRNERRIALKEIAQRLSSPLYGSLLSIAEARAWLRGAL